MLMSTASCGNEVRGVQGCDGSGGGSYGSGGSGGSDGRGRANIFGSACHVIVLTPTKHAFCTTYTRIGHGDRRAERERVAGLG